MQLKYKHHHFSFSLSASQVSDSNLQVRVIKALKEVFKGFIVSDSDEVALEFIFTDSIQDLVKDTDFIRVKDVKVGDSQVYFKDSELEFLIEKENKYKIYVAISHNETLKSSLRFFNKAFKNNLESKILTFYYRVFLLFSQLWNVENNSTYIHSSAIDINGNAILFSADSGVGKSSLLFRLSQDPKVKFIADDLTIINKDSTVFYQGRCLSVKPYHLKFYDFLKQKIHEIMEIGQKIQWKFIADNRLIYRISPFSLFKEVVEQSKLKRVIHLCNHSKDQFEVKKIAKEELQNYALPILSNELFLASKKLNILASLPGSSFNSSEEMLAKANNVLDSAFDRSELFLILVPYLSNPNDLYDFLKSEGCLN